MMIIPYRMLPNFKGLLFILGMVIIIGVLFYTDKIVNKLRDDSRRYLTLQVDRFRNLFMQDDPEALEAYLKEMASKNFPLIVADASGQPLSWSGLPHLDNIPLDEALRKARKYQQEWIKQGNQPVTIEIPEYNLIYYFYYGDSDHIRRLRYMPWVEVILVGGLILFGYFGFANIKKSEERSVWVGMAREAAHQLGTPLTSLMGWVELLESHPDDPDVQREVRRDIDRLIAVAERFNKIGSKAPLTTLLLLPVIEEAVGYVRRRLPQMGGKEVRIDVDVPRDLELRLNQILFGWVMENLLKNAVESLRGNAGHITVRARRKGEKAVIDLSDDGCGIPRQHWRNIFRPGYTTKERGWGVGLSLTRRIVEDLHKGRISVVRSNPETGTVIRMQLPIEKGEHG